MPIANSSNKIVIEFSGESADLLADVKAINKSFDQFVAQNKKISEASAKTAKTGQQSWTEFNSALSLVKQGFQYLNQAIDATSGQVVAYANDVRELGQVNGESAESNSRLIQTFDDYKVSVTDIMTASKKLKDQGLTPNIETVAKLAEEYQAIKNPADQYKFATDNLGKSSKAWLEVLKQSPDVLREQAAGIAENLILTQKQVDAARRLELAEDAKNDALQGVALTLGNKVIPVQTDFYNGINVLIRANEKLTEAAKNGTVTWQDFMQASDEAGNEIYQEQQAMLDAKNATDDLAQSQQDAEEAAKNLSEAYTGLLSAMFAIQSSNESYQNTIEDINQSDNDLVNKKFDLELAYQREQAAGKATADSYMDYMRAMGEVNQALDENIMKRAEASANLEKESAQRVYDLAQQRLAADGVIDSGEFEYLQNIAVQKGLVSQAAADQAIAESQAADAIISSYGNQATAANTAANTIIQSYSAANQVLANTLGISNAVAASFDSTTTSVAPSQYNPTPHAQGGSFMIPQSYGNEGFRMGRGDTASGGEMVTITPSGGNAPGATNNFTINIGSIRSQADLDYITQEVTRRMTN